MKYVQLRAGCHDLLIAVTEVAQILASAPEGAAVVQLCAAPCVFIRCVDGRVLGVTDRLHWQPWPGRHRLELVSVSGQTLQSVAFEVRGAGIKGKAAAR